ncbi:MAG: glycosyltransferase [Proteobacteria bacterium]|nr:glycosyltransferase [Pseudomonadota bacterium]
MLAYSKGAKLFRKLNFSPALRTSDHAAAIDAAGADIVHLHWVNYGYFSPEGIGALRTPVVWTLHDMWPFTGGCHYTEGCTHYRNNCGRCPVLGSSRDADLSSRLLGRKRAAWNGHEFSIVAPSTWMAESARAEGSLFARMPVSIIANPIDTTCFTPGDQAAARQKFGLPPDAPIVVFGGNKAVQNVMKGYPLLRDALQQLGRKDVHLAIFGSGEDARGRIGLDMPVHLLGTLRSDADIVDAYRAGDLFVLPSVQDNLPNTVAEALSCGTPVAAFRIGGVPDMVQNGINGFLANEGDTASLARAIAAGLEASRSGHTFQDAARRSAEAMFDPRNVAQAYLEVYRAALARKTA